MLNFFIFICCLPVVIWRFSRWLSIFQKKEYRFDRLKLYLHDAEGKKEILSVLPSLNSLTKNGFKRPKITIHIFVSLILSLATFNFLLILINNFYPQQFIFALLMIYLLIPVIIFISDLPVTFAREIAARILLSAAHNKIYSKNNLQQPIIIGITGSYGKTTTKLLTAAVIREKEQCFATPHSYNTKIGIAKSILNNYRGEKIIIIEFGAYKIGEIALLTKFFPPTLAIVTGFAPQHLGIFGSIENIQKAKSELITALKDNSTVFYNGNNNGVLPIINVKQNLIKVNFADKLIDLSPSLDKYGRLQLKFDNQNISTKLVGLHYLETISAAIHAANYLNIPNDKIVHALGKFTPPAECIKIYRTNKNALVFDDGKTSNPTGYKACLNIASHQKSLGKRVIFITGGIVDLGNQSHIIHNELAEKTTSIVDAIIYVNQIGLTEFKKTAAPKLITDEKLIKRFLQNTNENDAIFIEGYIPGWLQTFINSELNIKEIL